MFVVLFWGLAQGVFAQTPAQQGGADIQARVTQKQSLTLRFIENASVVARIQASQDAEALRLFALAKDSYASGLTAMKAGDFTGAEKQFNETISAMSKAGKQVPDTAALATKQRAEYEKKLASVESLKESYLGYLKDRKSDAKDKETEESASLGINRLMEAAKKHAAENQPEDALRTLGKAEQVMKSGMNRILGSTTIDFTPKFETLADEYNYELKRNRSSLELIPVAIEQFKPPEEVKKNIESLIEHNRVELKQASEYAGQKDYRKALESVHTGSGYLQNALTAAGLTVPQ